MICKLLVGTFTSGTDFHGIYEITLDMMNGQLSDLKFIAAAPDLSYMAISCNGSNLYAVCECADFMGSGQGGVIGFIRKDGIWEKDFESPSGGNSPCHVAVDKNESLLAVSNYLNGTVRIFSLNENGAIKNHYIDLPGSGKGPNPDRQECAHAHQCVFVSDELWCCDLGADRIRRYLLNGGDEIKVLEPIMFPAGSGPRHLVLNQSGERAYLATELSNELFVLHKAEDEWRIENRFDFLPYKANKIESYAAAIRLDDVGKSLYVSNRGHDSLSVFALSDEGAVISRRMITKCGGIWPRDILLIGDFILCACQKSDEITCLRVNSYGLYSVCSRIAVASPACLLGQMNRPLDSGV